MPLKQMDKMKGALERKIRQPRLGSAAAVALAAYDSPRMKTRLSCNGLHNILVRRLKAVNFGREPNAQV